MHYSEFTRRNASYIAPDLQKKIRSTRLLIAGCGLGALVAEVAVRTGFEHLVLVDGDTISGHNLNRQPWIESDIGKMKVDALANRLTSIHSGVRVESHAKPLSSRNVETLVESCDVVLDTVDFLDLPAVLALHDEARLQHKTVVSGFSCGWGAVAAVFKPDGASLRDVFGLNEDGLAFQAGASGANYPAAFRAGLHRLAPELPEAFLMATAQALDGMVEGRPCPAPQLAAGAYCTASLILTQVTKLMANEYVTEAPELILVDLARAVESIGIGARVACR